MPRIVLVSSSASLHQRWIRHAGRMSEVRIYHGLVETLFEQDPPPDVSTCAIVCPANSLLFMGGGFDLGVLNSLTGEGYSRRYIERYIQTKCTNTFKGYIPVTAVETVELTPVRTLRSAYTKWKVGALLMVPLMVVPEQIANGRELVFNWMWNTLVNCHRWDTVVVPGVGGGYGGIDLDVIAEMQLAAVHVYHLEIPTINRGLLILFLLGKDFRKFGGDDAEYMATMVTDHGLGCIGTPQNLKLAIECVQT